MVGSRQAGLLKVRPQGVQAGSGRLHGGKDWSLPGARSVAGVKRYSWQWEQHVQRHSDKRARPNTPKLGKVWG